MFKPGILETLYSNNIVHLGNTSIYRSQQGVIRDSPITPFERVGEVSRFSFFINSKFGHTPHTAQRTDTGNYYVLGLVLRTAQKLTQNITFLGVAHLSCLF